MNPEIVILLSTLQIYDLMRYVLNARGSRLWSRGDAALQAGGETGQGVMGGVVQGVVAVLGGTSGGGGGGGPRERLQVRGADVHPHVHSL